MGLGERVEARASARPRRAWWRPGAASQAALGLCVAVAVLDGLCLLPHPGAEGVPPPLPELSLEGYSLSRHSGVTAAVIRARYHRVLKAWAERAREMSKNLTQAALDYPQFKAVAVLKEGESIACRVAAAGFQARSHARVAARLQGSAVSHLLLDVRDRLVYGGDYTLAGLARKTRTKLRTRLGREPRGGEVCWGLVETSSRSNEAWDAVAQNVGEKGWPYWLEALGWVAIPGSVIVVMCYLLEIAAGFFMQAKPRMEPERRTAQD